MPEADRHRARAMPTCRLEGPTQRQGSSPAGKRHGRLGEAQRNRARPGWGRLHSELEVIFPPHDIGGASGEEDTNAFNIAGLRWIEKTLGERKLQLAHITAPGLTDELSSCVQSWGIHSFTQIQVQALAAGIADGRSQIVCAPTSSGKTLVGELAILAALCRGDRCIYLVSHKALADQKYLDFEARFGSASQQPRATVGLSTGDRDEGDVSAQLLVATYEKVLSLLLSGQLDMAASVLIADELQIIADETRGPNIETLCSIFRRQNVSQFVGLTATIGNGQELADWLGCTLVACPSRDVELHQEIWHANSGYSVRFGQEQGEACHTGHILPNDTLGAVRHLLTIGRGPVLVFTESRNEASDLASRYSQTQVRTAEGMALSLNLELFSEPTESSQLLQQNAQKRVAFHTADLTAQERQVVEQGFVESSFDVCFATSTLAAGVNFPFKSVVFSKLTYRYGEREGSMLTRSDYRNMSGRAGRLGLHPEGFAILLPQSPRELAHANLLVLPENDNVASQFVRLSMRRTVLSLVTSGVVGARERLSDFFQQTFYWHQIRERNPNKLQDVIAQATQSIEWLIEHKLIEESFGFLLPTPVGKAVAQSGLLPTTAIKFLDLLSTQASLLDAEFERHIPALIHWVCNCPEFKGERPSRFLPFPARGQAVNSNGYLSAHPLFRPLDRTDNQTNQCVHALILFIRGLGDRQIRQQTNIPSGQLHRLAGEIAWVFDGLRRIASVQDLSIPQTLTNKLSMIARQVQWGAPAEALDILRVAQREGVPGFGRQRAVALLQRGIQTFDQLLATAQDTLSSALGSDRRVSALLSAVSSCLGIRSDRFSKVHQQLAEKLGIGTLVKQCAEAIGTDYEVAIAALLALDSTLLVQALDDGRQQNVPDLLVRCGLNAVLIECKTTIKRPPVIKKEEAFAVLQKAADFDPAIRRVTLGKPGFDEHSKIKVQAARDIALVEHDTFIEGILRLRAGHLLAADFLTWLGTTGIAELDRLGGKPSFEILRGL